MRRIAIRFFMASQITITTIILYYFRGKGRRKVWLGDMEREYWTGDFYVKSRVERGRERNCVAFRADHFFLDFYCITVSVLLIFSSSLLSTMSIYTHHQVVSGSGDELGHNIANGRFNKKTPNNEKREVVRFPRGQHTNIKSINQGSFPKTNLIIDP